MIIKDTESIDIHTSTGPMRAHLFRLTTEGRCPGLLLFSEIFQVTGPIRRAASMLASYGFVVGEPDYRLIHIQRAHVTMTYNVNNTSPKMAVNTTHLNDFLTSASMSFLDLSNRSIRYPLVYGAGASSLQFSKPLVSFSMQYAGKTLEVKI
jgi:hypothetical protein